MWRHLTGLFAATLLRSFGIAGKQAIAIVRSHRPESIESTVQENFVLDWGFRGQDLLKILL